MSLIELKVPDIGGSEDVNVAEVYVKVGDKVNKDDNLVMLETDKATMEVPSEQAGIVIEVVAKVGSKVKEGDVIVKIEAEVAKAASLINEAAVSPVPATASATPPSTKEEGEIGCEIIVLGAGPAGYTAAFRAADLGKNVVLIEKYSTLGGVCLNVGCIPSKALLHVAKVINEAEEMSHHGVSFGQPQIDIAKIRSFKNGVVSKLTGGLNGLAKQRKVQVVQGIANFTSAYTVAVTTAEGTKTIRFESAIIAAGSHPFKVPGFPFDDPR
ncbi:MAG: FAD-dependent oxidoreductase, partial [Burkholderiales bacterium]